MAAVFDLILAPPRAVSISTPSADEALPVPGGGATVFGGAVGTAIPPPREPMMRAAYQTPCATDFRQTTSQEATEPTRFFDLTKHRFHADLPSGV